MGSSYYSNYYNNGYGSYGNYPGYGYNQQQSGSMLGNDTSMSMSNSSLAAAPEIGGSQATKATDGISKTYHDAMTQHSEGGGGFFGNLFKGIFNGFKNLLKSLTDPKTLLLMAVCVALCIVFPPAGSMLMFAGGAMAGMQVLKGLMSGNGEQAGEGLFNLGLAFAGGKAASSASESVEAASAAKTGSVAEEGATAAGESAVVADDAASISNIAGTSESAASGASKPWYNRLGSWIKEKTKFSSASERSATSASAEATESGAIRTTPRTELPYTNEQQGLITERDALAQHADDLHTQKELAKNEVQQADLQLKDKTLTKQQRTDLKAQRTAAQKRHDDLVKQRNTARTEANARTSQLEASRKQQLKDYNTQLKATQKEAVRQTELDALAQQGEQLKFELTAKQGMLEQTRQLKDSGQPHPAFRDQSPSELRYTKDQQNLMTERDISQQQADVFHTQKELAKNEVQQFENKLKDPTLTKSQRTELESQKAAAQQKHDTMVKERNTAQAQAKARNSEFEKNRQQQVKDYEQQLKLGQQHWDREAQLETLKQQQQQLQAGLTKPGNTEQPIEASLQPDSVRVELHADPQNPGQVKLIIKPNEQAATTATTPALAKPELPGKPTQSQRDSASPGIRDSQTATTSPAATQTEHTQTRAQESSGGAAEPFVEPTPTPAPVGEPTMQTGTPEFGESKSAQSASDTQPAQRNWFTRQIDEIRGRRYNQQTGEFTRRPDTSNLSFFEKLKTGGWKYPAAGFAQAGTIIPAFQTLGGSQGSGMEG